MKKEVEERLKQLQQEYQSGQQMLADLHGKQNELQQTLLRISGAMQVLQELLQAEAKPESNGAASGINVDELAEEVAFS